jgi:hypothetical protein
MIAVGGVLEELRKGLVYASPDDGPFLSSLGIKVGAYSTSGCFFIEASDSALSRLDAHAGRFKWEVERPPVAPGTVPTSLHLNKLTKAWFDMRPGTPRSFGLHPSELMKLCPVLQWFTEQARADLASEDPRRVQTAWAFIRRLIDDKKKDFSANLQMELQFGHDVHNHVQSYLGMLGMLWGRWRCTYCHATTPDAGWMPRVDRTDITGTGTVKDYAPCVACYGMNLRGDRGWDYVEPAVDNVDWGIVGHMDGDLRLFAENFWFRYVLEVKSCKQEDFELKIAKVLPKPEHVYQASIYAWLAGVSHICFIYVNKNQVNAWKEFVVPLDPEAVRDAQAKIRAVFEGRQSGRPPVHARACADVREPRAQACPAVEACFGCRPPTNFWKPGS